MNAHDLAKKLLSLPNFPVVLSPEHGPSVECCGTSLCEAEEPTPAQGDEEEDEDDYGYLSWNKEKFAYDRKSGSTITII